jgi:glycosyltransferase involved in cell wall biosynthesis
VAAVVPNGVDIEEYQPSAGEKSGASFVGATSWFPNLDALEHFANDVLPFLRQEIPDYQVSWVGSATDEQRRRFGALGIHLTGYVEDVKPYMAASSTFIVPLRVGGGTRLKILNAWSMGCAVISSSVGCEGLEARDGENIIIRDDPAEFARSMLDVERDPELRDRLGGVARRTAEAVYSWPVIGRDMVRRYQEAMSAAKTGSK